MNVLASMQEGDCDGGRQQRSSPFRLFTKGLTNSADIHICSVEEVISPLMLVKRITGTVLLGQFYMLPH